MRFDPRINIYYHILPYQNICRTILFSFSVKKLVISTEIGEPHYVQMRKENEILRSSDQQEEQNGKVSCKKNAF